MRGDLVVGSRVASALRSSLHHEKQVSNWRVACEVQELESLGLLWATGFPSQEICLGHHQFSQERAEQKCDELTRQHR